MRYDESIQQTVTSPGNLKAAPLPTLNSPPAAAHTSVSLTAGAERFEPVRETSHGKVITLAFLSERLPASVIVGQLARDLRRETGSSVALIQLLPWNTPSTAPPNTMDRVLDGAALPIEFPLGLAGLNQLRLGVNGEAPAEGTLNAWLEKLRRQFKYVLIQADTRLISSPVLTEFLLASDVSCPFMRVSGEDAYELDLLVRELRSRRAEFRAGKFKPVVCLGKNETVGDFDLRLERIGVPTPIFVRACPQRDGAEKAPGEPAALFGADVRRLARHLGGCLIGLALSSGGAKGLAHIGVIQVLEEHGIEVDVVAGSSMGAYVGALWNYGCDGRKLEALARELEVPMALWRLIDPVFPPRRGFLRGTAVKRRVMRTIGDVKFADLVRPLHVVAANLDTLERVVFSTGEVATAVHASVAVPGICVPVEIGDETFIDGGVVDPLPVDVLREMGVARIIAVNVIPTPDRIRDFLQVERELAQHPKKRAQKILRDLFPIDRELNYFARGNILEILMRSIHGAQIRVAEASCRQADVVLRPDVCDDRWVDYRSPGKYITRGRLIAAQHLDEMLALTRPKGKAHEHPPTSISMGGLT